MPLTSAAFAPAHPCCRWVWMQQVPPRRAAEPLWRTRRVHKRRRVSFTPPADEHAPYLMMLILLRRSMAVKNGATISCVARFGSANTAHAIPQASEPAAVGGRIRVQSRVARHSYGLWVGTGPKEHLTWFINKVCCTQPSLACRNRGLTVSCLAWLGNRYA